MPISVKWNGGEPPDVEEWEDLLQAEYGTALGQTRASASSAPCAWAANACSGSPTRRTSSRP
jgi:hypothetical protein